VKKRVRKFQGGGMDASQADFGDPGEISSDAGFANTTPSKVSTVNNQGGKTPPPGKDVPFKAPVPTIGPISALINVAAYANYKGRQKFAVKEGLHRDHYKTTGKTLQPNSPTGKEYLKDAGYNKPTTQTTNQDGPDPVKSVQAAQAVKPKIPQPYKPYYMGFDFQKPIDKNKQKRLPEASFKAGGLSGGKRFGPPPKKGPNPHGICPHRKDGIRGVGAVERGRGVKFVGVK